MIDPGVAQHANAEGLSAMQLGDFVKAAEAFARATDADPTALPLWSNLAHAWRLAGNAVGEQRALDKALALDRTDFGTQLRVAQLHQRLGDETKALIAWSGVQQLATQLPGMAPQIAEEVAAGRAYCEALQERLYDRVNGALDPESGSWDETEDRRIKAFVDLALGKRQVYHNECAGVLYPFLPEDEYFDRRHFPWLDELEAHYPVIKAEMEALVADPGEALVPYVRMDEGTPESEWSQLDHSLDWGVCFLWEYGTRNKVVCDRCPETAALLDRLPLAHIPGRAPNAFFSMLKPMSHIPPHTGVTNTRAIIHLALDIPPDCGFRVGNETREWVEGKAFVFDDSIEHEAWNRSNSRRAILIVDCWNPHLSDREQAAITHYFSAADGALSGKMF